MSDTKYPHDGYFSVSGRGEYGHWDISDGRNRVFRIRGDKEAGFRLMADPGIENDVGWVFDTPYAALDYAARQLILSKPQPTNLTENEE